MNPRHRLAALASVAVLALAACGGSEDSASDEGAGEVLDEATTTVETTTTTTAPLTGGGGSADTAEPETTEPDASEPETTEAEEAPTTVPTPETTEAPAPETTVPAEPDEACLEGAWVITTEQLNSYYSALAANSGGGLTLGADGVVNVTFLDGEYQYTADFGITVDVSGTGGTGDAVGTVNGSYEIVDDNVIAATTLSSDLTITVQVAGQTIDGSDMGNGLINSAPINNAEFFCGSGGEGPTVMFQSGPSTDQRHPVVLQAA
jgi:hypothetical protein